MRTDIARRRAARGISQAELADAIGVSRQTINAIERERTTPSLEVAFDLAAFFDCRIEDLFEYESPTAYTTIGF